jgi:hypothetical protein
MSYEYFEIFASMEITVMINHSLLLGAVIPRSLPYLLEGLGEGAKSGFPEIAPWITGYRGA